MKANNSILLLVLSWVNPLFYNAQITSDQSCKEDIYACEKKYKNDSLPTNNISYLNYVVKATNWDNETTVSNVELYQDKFHLNFFSEQAKIFRDTSDVIIIVPHENIFIVSQTDKKIIDGNYGADIMSIKKELLDSSKVLKCEQLSPTKKIIVFKTNPVQISKLNLLIETITYEFDPSAKSIFSIKTTYMPQYKLKQTTVIFKKHGTSTQYAFKPIRGNFLDKRGRVLAKYKNFEIIDNRDNDESVTKK